VQFVTEILAANSYSVVRAHTGP